MEACVRTLRNACYRLGLSTTCARELIRYLLVIRFMDQEHKDFCAPSPKIDKLLQWLLSETNAIARTEVESLIGGAIDSAQAVDQEANGNASQEDMKKR